MNFKKITKSVLILFFISVTAQLLAANTGSKPIVVGLVDLSAVIACHPMMRNFDYHTQKFVKSYVGHRILTGKDAWNKNKKLILKIKTIEAKIRKQVDLVNKLLSESFKNKKKILAKNKAVDNLKTMNKKHRDLLAFLVKKTMGLFPDNEFTDIDSKTGKYIMDDIRNAVYQVARKINAAFVFNTTSIAISGVETLRNTKPLKESSQDTLNKFNIKNINDLKNLLFKMSSTAKTPIGKPLAKMRFMEGGSGEHFAQIKDKGHMEMLMKEYYQNRNVFSDALGKYGSKVTLMQGICPVVEKNITREVISYIFELHHTKEKIKTATFGALTYFLGKN